MVLYIAGKYSAKVAEYKAVEFTGPTSKEMTLSGRMTVSNMASEIGAKFAFFEPDEKVFDYLRKRTPKKLTSITADEDACYEAVYEEDVSTLEPQVAFPYSVGNVKPISRVGHIKVDQVV
jgi:3-isopropylmalate/(R)-2-methylmalate dehydratase large subunit